MQGCYACQTHEHTLIILPKIILAGFQDLGSSACVADLSWACGGVFLFLFYFIPLPSSRDCSLVYGPTTWLIFATPVRGLELSEIWGLYIQICEDGVMKHLQIRKFSIDN